MRICGLANGIIGAGRAILLITILAIASGCSSVGNQDDWLKSTKRFAEQAAYARSSALTVAGHPYQAEARRCTAEATSITTAGTTVVDAAHVYTCMRSANEQRDKIEAAATPYATITRAILEADSWTEVLIQIPVLRAAAKQLADVIGSFGAGDRDRIEATLTAPIDEAERIGGAQ